MGGATSKLKENVWEEADGKVTLTEDCIDGAPPTSKYEIYHLTKRGVNQRDFDITDSESNLIYTTRQVPGTIACFDLLGKEIDNYLIRVTVDIARRYWTIYRFEEATFEGQKPDKEATEKLVAERLQEAEQNPMIENFNTPFLFRKAVIIVSWSRYMAVSSLYGPPSEEMLREWEAEQFLESSRTRTGKSNDQSALSSLSAETNGSASGSETPEAMKAGLIFRADSNDSDNMLDEGEADVNKSADHSDFQCRPVHESIKTQLSDEIIEEENSNNFVLDSVELSDVPFDTSSNDLPVSKSMPELESIDEDAKIPQRPFESERLALVRESSVASADSPSRERTSSETRRGKFRAWAKQKSQHIRERSMTALEKSGWISKTARRDPLEGVIHLNKPLLLCQEIYTRIIGNHQTSRITKQQAIELMKQDIAQHEKDDPEGAKKDEESDPLMTGQEVILRTRSEDSGDGVPESKSVDTEDEATSNGNGEEADDEANKEQPLVAYWLWENTLRTHKMKMHVAKGADLALHVVLAIIVNQVRYERNALAMTV